MKQKLRWLLYGGCVFSLVVELFTHRHGHFDIDGTFGFFAVLGFMGVLVMIGVSNILGFFLKVEEGYYDDESNG